MSNIWKQYENFELKQIEDLQQKVEQLENRLKALKEDTK